MAARSPSGSVQTSPVIKHGISYMPKLYNANGCVAPTAGQVVVTEPLENGPQFRNDRTWKNRPRLLAPTFTRKGWKTTEQKHINWDLAAWINSTQNSFSTWEQEAYYNLYAWLNSVQANKKNGQTTTFLASGTWGTKWQHITSLDSFLAHNILPFFFTLWGGTLRGNQFWH